MLNSLARRPLSFLRRVNLWPRLVVGVSLGFLGLFAILSILILRVVDDSRDRILQERLVIAQLTAQQIDGVLAHAFAEMEGAAGSAALQAPQSDSVQISQGLGQALQDMDDIWLGLYLLDSKGNAIAAAPAGGREPVVNLRNDPGFAQAMAGGNGTSAPFRDAASGRPAAMLMIPVGGRPGEAGVILGGVINLSMAGLVQPLNDARNLGKTGHAELVDAQGRLIASTDRVQFLAPGEHISFYLRMQQEGAEGVETVPYEAAPETGERNNHGDNDHIMAFAQLSNAPWGLAVGGAESETLAPVTDLRNKILLIGAGALAVLWVATLVGARLLVRPVRVLTGAADRIAAGDLESPIRVMEGGEIGRLGETLEGMRLRLKESLEEISRWGKQLETKVTERTEELKARNRELTALTAVATAANESPNLEQLVERCLSIVLEHTGMEAGAVRLLDGDKGKLVATSHQGAFAEFPCRERLIALDECPCGRVASTGEPMVGHPSEFAGLTRRACLEEGFNLMAVLPLKSPKGVQGVLYLGKRRTETLDARQTEMLTVMCNQIGVAIENAQLIQDIGKMEAQREMDRLKSEFMSAVSHELRTPLGFIKGYVTTLLRDDLSAAPETQREFLEIIGEESDKLQKLIDDLLDAARLHSGGLSLSRTHAKVGKIAQQAVEKMKVAFPERELVLDLPAAEPDVLVDPWRIEQVIQNLADNAIRYSPPGKAVNVRVRLDQAEMVVSVRDQGEGITTRELDRVFEPFYRGRNAGSPSPSGTGLGLTICRGIVEAHGGRIWADSRRGKGSTFRFALPLVSSDLGPEEMEPALGAAGGRAPAKADSSSPRGSQG